MNTGIELDVKHKDPGFNSNYRSELNCIYAGVDECDKEIVLEQLHSLDALLQKGIVGESSNFIPEIISEMSHTKNYEVIHFCVSKLNDKNGTINFQEYFKLIVVIRYERHCNLGEKPNFKSRLEAFDGTFDKIEFSDSLNEKMRSFLSKLTPNIMLNQSQLELCLEDILSDEVSEARLTKAYLISIFSGKINVKDVERFGCLVSELTTKISKLRNRLNITRKKELDLIFNELDKPSITGNELLLCFEELVRSSTVIDETSLFKCHVILNGFIGEYNECVKQLVEDVVKDYYSVYNSKRSFKVGQKCIQSTVTEIVSYYSINKSGNFPEKLTILKSHCQKLIVTNRLLSMFCFRISKELSQQMHCKQLTRDSSLKDSPLIVKLKSLTSEMSIEKLMLISLSGKTDNDHITIYKQFYECLIKRVCKQGIDDYITCHPEETLQEPIVITTKFLFIAQNFEASSLSLKAINEFIKNNHKGFIKFFPFIVLESLNILQTCNSKDRLKEFDGIDTRIGGCWPNDDSLVDDYVKYHYKESVARHLQGVPPDWIKEFKDGMEFWLLLDDHEYFKSVNT